MPSLYFPVVLLHGFNKDLDSCPLPFVERVLDEMEVEHFTPRIHPFGSIEERSTLFIKEIVKRFCDKTVHLIGHSMGGINARDIAAKALQFNLGFKVETVTTFGTPHRGVKWIPLRGLDGHSEAAMLIRRVFGTDFAGVGNLSHTFMTKFNKSTANNPNVKYFYWAGKTSIPMTHYLDSFAPSRLCGSTDGLVNVDSAEWGHDLGPGIHLGTVRGLNHMTIMCRLTIFSTIAHLQATEQGRAAMVQDIENGIKRGITRRDQKQETRY